MHKMHGSYAFSSLFKSPGRDYVPVTNRNNNQNKPYGIEPMNFVRSFSEWRRYRATCNELNRLSSRELNDLGINRGDIPFVARKVTRN